MTFTLTEILSVLFLHWLSDFVFQTDTQAKNKSKSNRYLLEHCLTYSMGLVGMGLIFHLGYPLWILFILLNFVLHFCTDYVTSRINSYLWAKGKVHDFFVSVGFDQLIHYTCLFGTLYLFRSI